MQKPDFIPRFFAWFIDNLILAIITFVIIMFIGGGIALVSQIQSDFLGILIGTTGLLLVIFLMLLQFLYFGFFWSRNGQSLGKKVVGIKVINKADGSYPSFIKAGLRGWFGYWLSALIFYLGYIWAAFDPEKEAWHDKLFGTAVVKAEHDPFA